MRKLIQRRNRNLRRGTTTVEMAVVAPVMLLMMLGCVEVGYAFLVKQTMNLATNKAGRVATLPGYTSDDVRASIDDSMAKAGLTGYEVSTNLDELGPTDRQVWVEIRIPISRVLFTGSLLGGETFELTSRKVTNRELDPNLSSESEYEYE